MKIKNKYIKILFLLLLITISFYANKSSAEETINFMYEINKASEKYHNLTKSTEFEELILKGRKSIANKRLKTLVPDADKTAFDYFILANMLFKSEPEASYSLMKTANVLMPENPYILFELAMHEHRSGNCKAAIPFYEKASKQFQKHQNKKIWVYITHCRLMLGDYKQALESWGKVNFSEHHISIEKSMYDIFSNKDLDIEREKMINSIMTGSAKQVCELIELDKNWEIDWWNVKIKKEFLEYDTELLKTLSKNNKSIESASELCLHGISLNDREFINFASQSGYWGATYKLPEVPATSFILIRELVKRKIATPEEILIRYEDQLVSNHRAFPDDIRTLNLLAYLYDATKNYEKLKKIDLHGWKNLKLQKYAESYVSRIPNNSLEYKSALEIASKDFPNSVRIRGCK